jgi:hypothetical protein
MIERIRSRLSWKCVGAIAYVLTFAIYLLIQRHGQDRAIVIPWTVFDLAIPVIPGLLVVYVLQLILAPLPFLFISKGSDWLRAAATFTAVAAVCMACHWFLPTRLQAWAFAPGSALGWLDSVDGRGNACPSLHAACAIVSLMLCHGLAGVPRWAIVLSWLWVMVMLIACISLRQHTVIDLVVGLLIGGVGAWISAIHRLERAP